MNTRPRNFSEVSTCPVPNGEMADTAEQALAAAEKLGYPCVIKAQVHAGGRGKAGGIKLARNRSEAEKHIARNPGHDPGQPPDRSPRQAGQQTAGRAGTEHHAVNCIWPSSSTAKRKCRSSSPPPRAGWRSRKWLSENPAGHFQEHVHPVTGLSDCHIRNLAFKLGLSKVQQKNFSRLLTSLYELFMKKDMSLVEINPLIVTGDDEVLALDAKINFDDNALFRHPEIAAWRDVYEEEPLEVEASKYELNYIRLDGNIGCMVNGAGLAMATMDIIKYYGGEPANFLDVGGATSVERVKEAFKILLADQKVRAVFVNIFGGIVRTDLVANGIVYAVKGMDIKIPIVIRLVGTNEEEGMRILRESQLNFITENELADAVRRVVELAKGD